MTGLIRKATLLTVMGLLVAEAAMAGVPSAGNSTVPANLRLGVYSTFPGPGLAPTSGAPNGIFSFTVSVKDGGGFAVQFTPVTIDFNACHNLYLAQDQPAAGVTIDCINHRVFATTNNLGVASFNIVGASNNGNGATQPSSPTTTPLCASVSASSQHLGDMEVITVDMDNLGGVTSADLGSEKQDVLFSQTHLPQWFARADQEGDLTGASPFDNDSADLGKFVDIYIKVLVVSQTNGGSCGDAGGTCCPVLN
jgi:hypothetical protein